MKQEDKELLLKDLSARLPYGVILNVDNGKYREDMKIWPYLFDYDSLWDAKPYLRPMSSMTEEEKVEYCDLQDKFLLSSQYPVTDGFALYDWLNKKMFDFRGLIPKSLAICTEKFNPYKD